MNKILMIIMVLGLAFLSPANTQSALSDSFISEDTPMAVSSDVSIVVPSDCTLVCFVYLETADIGRPVPISVSTMANITTQLPDTATIILLGLGGLLYRRRKE
jgi:hypothetical protein